MDDGGLNPIEQRLVGRRKLKHFLNGGGLDQNLIHPVPISPGSQGRAKGLGDIALKHWTVSALVLNRKNTGASPIQRIRLPKDLEGSIEEGFGVAAVVDPYQVALNAQLVNEAVTAPSPNDDQYSHYRDKNEQLMNHGFFLAVQPTEQACPRSASAAGQSRKTFC